MFNFSKYETSDCEKEFLVKGSEFILPVKNSDCADFFVISSCSINIHDLTILPNEDLDFVKAQTKEVSFYSHCNYQNKPQHLSKKAVYFCCDCLQN